eukprot:gene13887-16413_t
MNIEEKTVSSRLRFNTRLMLYAESMGGVTALLRAVHAGQLEAVSVLLEAGANIHATDKQFGQAPIHISVLKGHDHILRVLLDSHANVETATQDGNTAHSIAISKNLSSVVGLLDTFVQGTFSNAFPCVRSVPVYVGRTQQAGSGRLRSFSTAQLYTLLHDGSSELKAHGMK